jgi:bacillithiol system protein YtxJ
VTHESPQALWIQDGAVIWHASHGAITQASLKEATARP